MWAFNLDRAAGGSAYQWTWDGVERISDQKTHELINNGNGQHTTDFDRKTYGSTKVEEAPVSSTTVASNDNITRPQKVTISKDRGDQPPQVYEEVETEPGVGEYVPPEDVEILPEAPRPEPPRQTYVAPPAPVPAGGTTEYRRRYEHKIVSSRVIPGDVGGAYHSEVHTSQPVSGVNQNSCSQPNFIKCFITQKH